MYAPLTRAMPEVGVTYLPRRVGQQKLPLEIDAVDQTITAKVSVKNVGNGAGEIIITRLPEACMRSTERKTVYLEPGQVATLTFAIPLGAYCLDSQRGKVLYVMWRAEAGGKQKHLRHGAFKVKLPPPPAPAPTPEFLTVEYTTP